MIDSMTAFARTQNRGDFGSLICEMRSINHRYLEMSIHLPEELRRFEMSIREQIKHQVARGKIECSIRYQIAKDAQSVTYSVNMPLALELCSASEKIATFLRQPATIDPAAILSFPGVLSTKETDATLLEKEVLSLVDSTIADLVQARKREGSELSKLFSQRLEALELELNRVRQRLPSVLEEVRERLRKRFADVKLELDANRLEQEIVIFAQKIDIAEEIDRTETHIAEMRRILQQGGTAGRRLDFLLQELNREANTLGSKSVDSVITHAAVEMKVLIEQIREQVQNVE